MDAEKFESTKDMSDAIAFGCYLVAQDIRKNWQDEKIRSRMREALIDVEAQLKDRQGRIAEYTPRINKTGFREYVQSLDINSSEQTLFAIHLLYSNPFAPFDFNPERIESKKDDSVLSLAKYLRFNQALVAIQSAIEIKHTIRKEIKAVESLGVREHLKDPKKLGVAAASALGLTAVAVVSAPTLAVLLPAAQGLSGAAAVSAGLASIGGGSIAAGGMGMAGGMAVLGMTGAVTGASAGMVGASAIMDPVESYGDQGALLKLGILEKYMILEKLDRKKLLRLSELTEAESNNDDGIDIERLIAKLIERNQDRLAFQKERNSSKSEQVKSIEMFLKRLKVYQKVWRKIS